MVYSLRKRRAETKIIAEPPPKKVKSVLKRWQNESPVKLRYKKVSHEALRKKLPVLEKLKRYQDEAAEELQDEEVVPEDLRGREVENIRDLKSNEEYVKWGAGKNSNLDFILRKKQTLSSDSLRIKETNFDLQLSIKGRVKHLTLQGFMGSLWDVFEKMFDSFAENKTYDEICFHATHDELDGSLSSSIFELKVENRDRVISEIMSRINAWNESSRIGSAIRNIQLSVTLLQRNLPGNGILLAVSDDNLRRKAFSQSNFTGSILYVESTENCFYISIYFCLLYNAYQLTFNASKDPSERRHLKDCLWESLALKGENLER